MTPRRSALWGLIGTLSFLVLHQAYLLTGGTYLGLVPVVGVAVLVGVLAGVLSYVVEPRVAERLSGE